MSKKLFILVLIGITLCSCINKTAKTNSASIEAELFIHVLQDNSICMNVQAPQIDSIRSKMPIKTEKAPSMYYFVDGSCSDCISKLLKVIDLKNKYKCKSKMKIVVEYQFHSLVEQYLDEIFHGFSYDMIFVEGGFISRNDLNGCALVIKNGNICGQTQFIDTQENS